MKNLLFKLLTIGLLSIVTMPALAVVIDYSPGTTFKIIQDEFVFDSTTVKSAKTLKPRSPVDHFYRVDIELTPDASNKMQQLTSNNLGKKALIVINGNVVSATTIRSPLNNQFEITGLSQSQAQQLVSSLYLGTNNEG